MFQVNGKDISKATHQDAVMALIAPTYEIKLVVRHDPPPLGMQVLLFMPPIMSERALGIC